MNFANATLAFASLANETRLKAFKLMVASGPDGLAAGVISKKLNLPHNTLSFHLSHLIEAGLIQSKKQGRSIIYSANYEQVKSLICFLVENCCAGEAASIEDDLKTGKTIIELLESCTEEPY